VVHSQCVWARCLLVGVPVALGNGLGSLRCCDGAYTFLILFFLYFLVAPGGASEGPAGPPTPQSVGKAHNASN